MRDSYRRDLREVKQITDFKYVRFHAIFHDEVGIYNEDDKGQVQYNFSYVDQIYDGLLATGVRPFVELSFMPKALASNDKPFTPSGTNPTSHRPRTTPSGMTSSRSSQSIWSNATASTK